MHNIFWALLILFAIAALLRMDWVYYLVYVVGGVWLFSHWWIRRSLNKIQISRHMLTQAFVGERIAVRLSFLNRSWLPLPWLQIEERVPLDLRDSPTHRVVLTVGGRAQSDFRYDLYCKRRGYYAVGPMGLNTGDLFGFVEAGWQENEPIYVTVYPQVLALPDLGLPSRSPFGVLPSRQRMFEDPNRLAGVRDYATGDSLRRIHWKASAHEDRLLVKKFQPAIALNVTIVLDLNRNAYPYASAIGASEWAITVAASIASHFTKSRQPIGLLCNGIDCVSEQMTPAVPAGNGQGHLMNILTLLARIQLHDFELSLADWLPRQIADLEWGSTLVVVTPYLDEAGLWLLHNAYRRGSSVTVLICAPQQNFDAIQAQGGKLNVHIYRTIWESDLNVLAA